MKPSLTVQVLQPSSNPKTKTQLDSLHSEYKFLERISILGTQNDIDALDFDTSSFTFLTFTATLDKFFTSEFITKLSIFSSSSTTSSLLIRSTRPFSELTDLSCTIDNAGIMNVTMSRSLDQSSGLDASHEIVDSANFDSSSRLLSFNLPELSKQKKKLERIQRLSSSVLCRPEYSCEYFAVVSTSNLGEFVELFQNNLKVPVAVDDSLRPKMVKLTVPTCLWPKEEIIELSDPSRLMEIFEWIGMCLKVKSDSSLSPSNQEHELQALSVFNNFYRNSTDFIELKSSLTFLSISCPILPLQLYSNLINFIQNQNKNTTIASLKCCEKIPPSVELNCVRSKHFNKKKFDPTACTADQSALALYISKTQIISFRLNSTA